MSTALKVFFAVVISLLLGIVAYLGYVYFTGSPNQAAPTPTIDRSQAKNYEGVILCIEEGGTATDAASLCSKGLFMDDGKTYELLEAAAAGVDNFAKGDRVRVVAVLSQGISPLGLDGSLNVFEIQKQALTQ